MQDNLALKFEIEQLLEAPQRDLEEGKQELDGLREQMQQLQHLTHPMDPNNHLCHRNPRRDPWIF